MLQPGVSKVLDEWYERGGGAAAGGWSILVTYLIGDEMLHGVLQKTCFYVS